ncbi:MAG: tyrosine-type recombinase/integrase [Thiofilum sp.]|uniref:tyrosine-type recombinase/integrase n=1 Tax=Thiofilum sp. TaxID=2212733 RepID=UPI0025DE62A2|nr:tyrosine-type recombinase/integrase [Thiofilum sp.]MBK8451754.1 site-specific integrase [Thiofilum sp.]
MTNTYTNHKGIKAALTSPPSTGHLEHKDTLATGLYLRVYSTGLGNFIHRYKIKGIRRVYTFEGIALNAKSTEKDIASALTKIRALHQEQRNTLATGLDVAIERDLNAKAINAIPTVSEFATTFIERYAKPKNKAWQEQERILKADVSIIGTLKINAVERKHIIRLLDKKEDAGAPVARNRLLSLLSKYFGFALERGLIEVNPAKGIKKLPEKARDRVLSDNEIRLFWQWLESNKCELATNSALKLALLTGQRVDEICTIQERYIQGDWWLIPDPKNSIPHTVFLTDTVKAIIETLRPHSHEGYLITDLKNQPKDAGTLAGAMYDAAITWESEPRPTPHDLRRTFTTGISKLGFNRLVQDKVTNHKDNSVGGIYDRNDYQKEKRQALEAWERHIQEILTGEPVSNVIAFKTA